MYLQLILVSHLFLYIVIIIIFYFFVIYFLILFSVLDFFHVLGVIFYFFEVFYGDSLDPKPAHLFSTSKNLNSEHNTVSVYVIK